MANVSEVRWIDDPHTESILRRRKIPVKICRESLDDIDFDAVNRGRIEEKIDDNRITEYAMAMLDGDAFPRPVLNRRPGHKLLEILSGNHRCRGVQEAEFAELEAYVVEIDDDMLRDLLPMLFNIHHGINVPDEAKYAQARFMVETYGLNKRQAAQDYRISYDGFCNYLRGLETVHKLARFGIDGAHLSRPVQVKLLSISNDNIFTAVGQLLERFKLDTERAVQLIKEAREAPTELEALQVVSRVNDQLVQERRSDRQTTPVPHRDKLFRQANGLINILIKYKTAKACQITTPQDLVAINDKIKTIIERAIVLFGYPGVPQPGTGEAATEPAKTAGPEPGKPAGPVPGGRGKGPGGRRTTHVR